jgi:hypothetical protein
MQRHGGCLNCHGRAGGSASGDSKVTGEGMRAVRAHVPEVQRAYFRAEEACCLQPRTVADGTTASTGAPATHTPTRPPPPTSVSETRTHTCTHSTQERRYLPRDPQRSLRRPSSRTFMKRCMSRDSAAAFSISVFSRGTPSSSARALSPGGTGQVISY